MTAFAPKTFCSNKKPVRTYNARIFCLLKGQGVFRVPVFIGASEMQSLRPLLRDSEIADSEVRTDKKSIAPEAHRICLPLSRYVFTLGVFNFSTPVDPSRKAGL